MTEHKLRVYASRLMPDLADEIMNNDNCFDTLLPLVRDRYRDMVLSHDWPDCETTSYAAYLWAERWPEDRELMRDKVTGSYDAFLWSKIWPEDREIMRDKVANSRAVYYWAVLWPEDRAIMRDRVTDPYDAYWWAERWPEDRGLVMDNVAGLHALDTLD